MRQLPLLFAFLNAVLLAAATTRAIDGLTPAQKSIQRAQESILKHSGSYEPYNALAMAEARRARETSDVKHYAEAEKALAKSFELSPANYEGLKIQTWLLLGRHEFARA